jgi:hypothetical protein
MVSPSFPSDQIAQLVRSIVQTGVASGTGARDQRIPHPRSIQAEPTIHVTIGRIEVRAMPPQQSPSRERAVSPVMSLEEYLLSRQKRAGL